MERILIQLKKIADKKTYRIVAADLGYKSPGTISNWFKVGTLPTYMKPIIKNYIAKEKKNGNGRTRDNRKG